MVTSSSWVFSPFGGPSPPSSSVLCWFSWGFLSLLGSLPFTLALPCSFLRLLGFPSVCPPIAPRLGLARLGPCVLLFSLLCDSVESQFLRDGVLPPGRVSAVGIFVHSFSWFRFLSTPLGVLSCLFRFLSFLLLVVSVSLCLGGSSLRFLSLS